ncbi:hypothetical protein [Lonsdalea quercina]|uniref:hypothetical protein n=1 Tax=Lonsdalea quercina TaxID=71657 RepID=UPI003975C423
MSVNGVSASRCQAWYTPTAPPHAPSLTASPAYILSNTLILIAVQQGRYNGGFIQKGIIFPDNDDYFARREVIAFNDVKIVVGTSA